MKLTRNEFAAFRADIKKALAEVEAKYGVEITPANIKYSDQKFDLKLIVAVGSEKEAEEKEFAVHAPRHGFRAEDYLLQFAADGKLFELCGFNNNSPKNNCKIREVGTGRTYKCSGRFVQAATLGQ